MNKFNPLALSSQFYDGMSLVQQGLFAEASSHFLSLPNASEKALGMSRIATRVGQFSCALAWIKTGLAITSREYLPIVLALHAALGELLIRAGKPQDALLHMQIVNQLRPKGQSDRQRHYSYLGISLARLGHYDIAEMNYMRAFVLARQQHDDAAASHALSRRAALSWHSGDEQFLNQSLDIYQSLAKPDNLASCITRLLYRVVSGKNDVPEVLQSAMAIPGSIEHRIELLLDQQAPPQVIDVVRPANLTIINDYLPRLSLEDIDLDQYRVTPSLALTHLFV